MRCPLVTFTGHSMGGMAALSYLGLPCRRRPIDPTALVLVATAAGGLAHRGIGRLLATPAPGGGGATPRAPALPRRRGKRSRADGARVRCCDAARRIRFT